VKRKKPMQRGNILIKRRNNAFLKGPDISMCPRCGESADIIHIFDKDHEADYPVIGFECCRCLYATGEANIFTALMDKLWLRYERRGRRGK
jgi:hypothetical protein